MRTFSVPTNGAQAEASWSIRFDKTRDVTVRFRGQTVDSTTADGPVVIERKFRPFRPFGLIPDFSAYALPAWLIGYLLIVIPFVPLLKKGLRIQ